MPNDRRRFLVAGATGLAALLMPKLSFAGIFHRGGRKGVTTTYATPVSTSYDTPVSTMSTVTPLMTPCQLSGINWYTGFAPSMPGSTQVRTAPAQYEISVYGTGLATWAKNGGAFTPTVQDPTANWVATGYQVIPDNGTLGYDTLNFWANETGSTVGNTSTVTITITLSSGTCRASWTQPVTYA